MRISVAYLFLTAASLIVINPTAALALDYYVNGTDGDDAISGLSPDQAFKTITHALTVAHGTPRSPATINIAKGRYAASTNGEAFPLTLSNCARLVGVSRDRTIIDAESDDLCTIILENVWGVFIERLRLVGSSAGAIHCADSELALIECVITGNTKGSGQASGLYASSSLVTVTSSKFFDNQGGAVVYFSGSTVTVTGSKFFDNQGGAVVYSSGSTATMANCDISDNRGQACLSGDSSLLISNCLIQRNASSDCPGVDCVQSDVEIEDTRIIDNACTCHLYPEASAIACWYCSCCLNRCLIECNESKGPIVEMTADSSWVRREYALAIEDSLIRGNVSDWKAFIYWNNTPLVGPVPVNSQGAWSRDSVPFTLLIKRCTLAENRTSDDYTTKPYLIFREDSSVFSQGGGLIDTVVWGNDGRVINWTQTSYYQSIFPIEYCCLQAPADSWGNFCADPLFTDGPLGDCYLSSVGAGQDADSPCINAGSTSASAAGVSCRTTRTDGELDVDAVDIGYHYSATPPTIDCRVKGTRDPLLPGDLLSASINIENNGLPFWVDVYAAFILPNGLILCIAPDGLTTDLVPWAAALCLPSEYASGDIVVFETQIPGGLPEGGYTFAAALSLTREFRPTADIAEFGFALGG